MLFLRRFFAKARARRFFRKHKIDHRSHQLWFDLLVKHGYRPDQLIPVHWCQNFQFSTADISGAVRLVQNPDNLAITPEMQAKITRFVMHGYMPHRLEIGSSGEVHLDYEGIKSDSHTIAFAVGHLEQRRFCC
jgi:hypothetical protein